MHFRFMRSLDLNLGGLKQAGEQPTPAQKAVAALSLPATIMPTEAQNFHKALLNPHGTIYRIGRGEEVASRTPTLPTLSPLPPIPQFAATLSQYTGRVPLSEQLRPRAAKQLSYSTGGDLHVLSSFRTSIETSDTLARSEPDLRPEILQSASAPSLDTQPLQNPAGRSVNSISDFSERGNTLRGSKGGHDRAQSVQLLERSINSPIESAWHADLRQSVPGDATTAELSARDSINVSLGRADSGNYSINQ